MEIDSASEAELTPGRLSLYVFLTIRTAQLQHGLRHGDYERYRHATRQTALCTTELCRKYCSARLVRLRRKLGITHRRTLRGGKPANKPPELHTLTDPRVLHIPLVLCERAWAYGMQKKGELGAMGHSVKRRGTMLRKLTQAVRSANALIALCEQKCDKQSCLEATSYAEMIKGIYSMESETKWKEGVEHFTRAKQILQGLAKISEVEVQSVFLQAVEEMEPNIRFCKYELQKRGLDDVTPTYTELAQELEQLEIKEEKQDTLSALSISWCQNQYPVRNERLSEWLQIAQKHERQLSSDGLDYASLVGLYEKVMGAYTDMESNIKKALAAGGGASVFAGEDLEELQMAVVGKLLRHSTEKTKLQINRNQELFQDALLKSLTSKKQQGVKTKAETLVRLCDSAIGLVLEQSELGMKLGGAAGEQLSAECTIQAAYFQAFRSFYLAHVMKSSNNLLESYALFERCIERTNIAVEYISDLMEDEDLPFTAELAILQKKADAFKCATQSEMAAEKLIKIQEAQQKLEAMEIEGAEDSAAKGKKSKKASLPAQKYMADHLNQWEAFVGAEGRNIRLFKIPPPLSTIPVRPFILDSTPNHIHKPDLKHRLPPEEAQGVFSKLFGFSGWK